MKVPEAVRKVPRPTNTVVIDTGSNTPKRYVVRSTKSVKYVKGGNPQPCRGPVIGYIYEGKFVPRETSVDKAEPEVLSWALAAWFKSLSRDLEDDLFKVMDIKDALTCLVIAGLRISYPGVSDHRLASKYEKSFFHVLYPGLALSRNKVSDFLHKLGMAATKRKNFFLERLKSVAKDHHIVIDGTLVQDSSRVNDLSGFSYKARTKGCQELSILYAYDLEKVEPICAQVFPGSHPDVSTCREFLTSNHIEKGILVADKGFNLKEIRALQQKHEDLHFIVPLKRNDSRLASLNLLKMKEVMTEELTPLLCSKAKAKNGCWLYAFKDTARAAMEERTYLERSRKNHDFDPEEYEKKKSTFGLIAFESDCDLTCEKIYATYRERWQLELIFKQYKTGLDADRTRVHEDFSVFGSEFINFLCTVVTSRMVQAEKKAKVLEEATYGEILEDLREVWRSSDSEGKPDIDDGQWFHTTKEAKALLVKLGLATGPAPEPPKKKGRPKKKADPEEPKTSSGSAPVQGEAPCEEKRASEKKKDVVPELVGPKRPKGRPRKIKIL